MSATSSYTGPVRPIWVTAFSLVALAMVFWGNWYYRGEAGHIRQEKYEEIASIAEMKTGQIAQWRRERLADVSRAASGPRVITLVIEFVEYKNDAVRAELKKLLEVNLKGDLYANVFLIAPDGKLLLCAKDESGSVDPVMQQTGVAALASSSPVVSDIFCHSDGGVHIDVASVVRDAGGRPLAVMILRNNAADYLYPMIQFWPTRSPTAETILVQRQGAEIIFLNELRHRSRTALSVRELLSLTNLPTVQAVSGKQGLFQGKDYRGEEVLADLRPVPGFPWYMVTKVDTSEILAEVRYRARSITLIVVLGILFAASLITFGFRWQQAAFFRGLYQSERELRMAQNEFRAILYSIGDAVISTDKAGRVRQMNKIAEEYTGWPEVDALGQPLEKIFRIINEETRATVENPVQRVLREGVVVGMANHTLLIARNGAERPIADSAAPIHQEGGAVAGVVLIFRDQTAERTSQNVLALERSKLKAAFENTAMGLVISDGQGGDIFMNAAALRFHGFTSVDEMHQKVREYADEWELRDPYGRIIPYNEWPFVRAIRGDFVRDCELYYRNLKSGYKWVCNLTSVPVRNSAGEVTIIVQTILDITERKRTEAELLKMQKLQSIGILAGGIAHDFNNIMMGLFGNIALTKDELPPDHPGRKTLEGAEKCMNRAVRLTKQLLTFAKGGDPVKEDVSLCALVEETTTFDLSGSNVVLVYQKAADLWLAKADKGQIQQVISNLTMNARQAMPMGGHLYITLENEELPEEGIRGLPSGKYIKITVRDEGTGIDPKHMNQLFDPYFTTKTTGHGLGLATSYSIITKHGGHIGVESELGKGATFTIYLPASASQTLPQSRPLVAGIHPLKPDTRILVLDDEQVVRMVATRWLEKMGCVTETTEDGQQAIDMYQQALKAGKPFDVIILDLTIPGRMGGLEVLKEIQTFDPNVNAIVSSGYAEGTVMSKYAFYGFKGAISKPYTESELLGVLGQVLK